MESTAQTGRKITSIQIDEETLFLLKKWKQMYNVNSYAEAIRKIAVEKRKKKSFAGSLKKYFKGQSTKDIVKEMQDERRKSDRF